MTQNHCSMKKCISIIVANKKILCTSLFWFLTLSCRVVTKGKTFLNKSAVFSCIFVWDFFDLLLPPGMNGLTTCETSPIKMDTMAMTKKTEFPNA